MKVEVYTKNNCPYCTKAKEYLNNNGIPFETKIFDDFESRNLMYDELGLEGNKRSVPQIFIDGKRIGGYTDLINSDIVSINSIGNFEVEF